MEIHKTVIQGCIEHNSQKFRILVLINPYMASSHVFHFDWILHRLQKFCRRRLKVHQWLQPDKTRVHDNYHGDKPITMHQLEPNNNNKNQQQQQHCHCGLVGSAPAWNGTGCEFDSWQCRIYIPCSLSLRLLGSLWGSLGTYGLTQKLCWKNNKNNNNNNKINNKNK